MFNKPSTQNTFDFSYMVPKEGLEPSSLAALVPKTSVSTNFTTWAGDLKLTNFTKFLSKKQALKNKFAKNLDFNYKEVDNKIYSTNIKMKLFPLAEANRTLPLVKQIVLDIQRKWGEAQFIKANMRKLYDSKESIDEKNAYLKEIELKIEKLTTDIEYHIKEIEDIGCILKDPDLGLVYFTAPMSNRIVYLCWQINETDIVFWHEINEAYINKKMIDERFLLAHC